MMERLRRFGATVGRSVETASSTLQVVIIDLAELLGVRAPARRLPSCKFQPITQDKRWSIR
jgi:hypothetical protein